MTLHPHPLALTVQQLGPQPDSKLIKQALDQTTLIPAFIGQDRAKSALAFAIGIM